MNWGRFVFSGVTALLASSSIWHRPAAAQTAATLPDIVVTPTGRPEPIGRIVGTTQIIARDTIERSTAKSVTDLLAESAVGFFSEWTPGQTSINIRGAASDGQGRDFRSQILVLVNGHRAGTANISKLSLADVERIEIVRGPASVVYGSQNMGGVINIITKTGRSAPGSFFDINGGSWDLVQGKAQTGGMIGPMDYYVGVSGGRRDDFHIGGGRRELNTDWGRKGIAGAMGVQINPDHHVGINVRSDGVYDVGFRGSSANVFAEDDRVNKSYDLNYNGKIGDGRFGWFFQLYGVHDLDDLNNPSPLSAAVTPRTSLDRNRRELEITGTRLQPRAKLWTGNDLLLGWDWENSRLHSTRDRLGLRNAVVPQLSPSDNNQGENVHAYYFEDAQGFFNDRLVVRGGMRWTYGTTTLEPTPYAPTLIPGGRDYDAKTYSAGSTLRVTDWFSTRVGTSTGFRAPTATELGANFTVTPIGNTILGNPGLTPEQSTQVEAGATFDFRGLRVDVAVFENKIEDRITTALVSSNRGVNISRTVNNSAEIVVQGVELQWNADVLKMAALQTAHWNWVLFGNGYYHFDMVDNGAPAAAGSNKATRIYQYQASTGTRFGESGKSVPWHNWSLQILGILRGPMWYNTEERLLPAFAPGQVVSTTVYRKDAFWTWNLRGEVDIAKNVKLYAAINNVFDVNQHPIFIALDQFPCIQNPTFLNGACGNSMPGREFLVGLQARL
jgi:vitamin B12 transporter